MAKIHQQLSSGLSGIIEIFGKNYTHTAYLPLDPRDQALKARGQCAQ